ncbi:MAG: hypothetical protein DMG28_10565 [Acidobacteria bacterium]|nr:MAG: hypothetical protein DMG28_10565 [Acidobacteriota bacterium]
MNKGLIAILAGALLLTVTVPARPGRAQENPRNECEGIHAQLEREQARLKAEMARMTAELKRLRDAVRPVQLAEIEDRPVRVLAALEPQNEDQAVAEIDDDREEIERRVETVAELAAHQAVAEIDDRNEVWLLNEGDRGWLGVTIAEVTADKAKELKLPAARGVILSSLEADGPAAKAGLKANDVITEFNGQRVEGTLQFRRLIRETPGGRTVQLTFWRDGRAQSVSVELGAFPDKLVGHGFGPKEFKFEMPEFGGKLFGHDIFLQQGPRLGIDAEDLRGQLGSYFGAPDGEGVLVRDVASGTPAEKAGLKAGDVIIKIDGERVRTVHDLREKMRAKRENKTVSVSVIRKGTEMSFNVEVEQPRPSAERKKVISRRISI